MLLESAFTMSGYATTDWPELAQRFWRGMCESMAVNGRVIVHPSHEWIAEELLATAADGGMPRAKVMELLAKVYPERTRESTEPQPESPSKP